MACLGLSLFSAPASGPRKKKGSRRRTERLVDRPGTAPSALGDALQRDAVRRGLLVVGALAVAGLGYWACRRLLAGPSSPPPDAPELPREADVQIFEYFDAQKGVYVYSTDPIVCGDGQRLTQLVEVVNRNGSDMDDDDDGDDDTSSASGTPHDPAAPRAPSPTSTARTPRSAAQAILLQDSLRSRPPPSRPPSRRRGPARSPDAAPGPPRRKAPRRPQMASRMAPPPPPPRTHPRPSVPLPAPPPDPPL